MQSQPTQNWNGAKAMQMQMKQRGVSIRKGQLPQISKLMFLVIQFYMLLFYCFSE